jgi:hypothetical protein
MAANPQPQPGSGSGRPRRVPATICNGCGEIRLLQGPMYSWRLKASYWELRCDRRRPDYDSVTHDPPVKYWQKKDGGMEPMPSGAIERMHTRAAYPFLIPVCCEKRMNPQKKIHALEGGSSCEILHCRCRQCNDASRDVFLVLPGGIEAQKDEWGLYTWKDAGGQIVRTKPRRAGDGTAINWRPSGFEDWAIERQMFGLLLISNPTMKNGDLGQLLDDSRLPCPFGRSWEQCFTQPGSGATWMAKLRRDVRRPARR